MPAEADSEYRFSQAGKGWLRYGGLAVDEPLAVGAHGLTDAARMTRSLDIVGNRQFLDRIFNSATKGNFEQGPGPRPGPLPVVSVVDQPSAIWRPTLENVLEWREFAQFIHNKVRSRVQNETSPAKVKRIINDAIRNELKRPSTDAGRKLKNALERETGVKTTDLFRPVGRYRQLWTTSALPQTARPANLWSTAVGRQRLFSAGTLVAAAIVSYAESASAANAQAKAKDDLIALSDSIGRYATDHPDRGVLIVQVYEIRKMTAESAAITTYRYTTVAYGRKEHDALWNFQDRSSISMATDVFSTEYQDYLWVPPLNERGPIPGPPPAM